MADDPRPATASATEPAAEADFDGIASGERPWADLTVGLVVVVQFLTRTAFAARGSWFADDWGFLSRASNGAFGLDDRFIVHGGQLHPFLWDLFQIQQWAAPGSYPAAALSIGLLQAISVVLVYMVLRRIFGARLPVAALVAWFAFTPLTLEPRLWTTVAFYTLPFQIGLAATLLLFLRYVEAPSRRSTLLVVLGQVLALLCWQKALYIPVVLFVLAASMPVLSEQALGWREALRHFRPLWSALVLVNAVWIGLYIWLSANHTTHYGVAGWPGLRALAAPAWLLFRNFSVSLLGGPWQWDQPTLSLPDPPLLLSVVSVAGLGILLAWCWWNRRVALPMWFLVGTLLAVDFALVAYGRLKTLPSVEYAGYLRYVADLAIPTVLALGFTFLRLRTLPTPSAAAPDSETASRSRPVTAGLLGVFMASAIVSSATLLHEWGQHPGTDYLANLSASLREMPSPPLLLVQDAPPEVIAPYFSPHNTTPVIVAVLEEDAIFVEYLRSDHPPLGVLPSGDIGPVEIGPTPFTLTYSSEPGPAACGWILSTSPVFLPLRTIIPDEDIPAGRWHAQIELISEMAATMHIEIGRNRLQVEVPGGRSDLYFSLFGPADGIRLSVDDSGTETCVRSVLVGQLVSPSP